MVGRGSLGQLAAAIREVVQSRSRLFWVVAGITAVAATLRLADPGACRAITTTRSSPPAGSCAAASGTRSRRSGRASPRHRSTTCSPGCGRRSSGPPRSACDRSRRWPGIAVVPVAFLIGAELSGRRTGLAAAALVAANPMLVWYSQEARCYSLLVLLTSISLLFFLRARRTESGRDIAWWALASALALATHYFAVFAVGGRGRLAAVAPSRWRPQGARLGRGGRRPARPAGPVADEPGRSHRLDREVRDALPDRPDRGRLHGRGDRRSDRRAGPSRAGPGPGPAGRGRLRLLLLLCGSPRQRRDGALLAGLAAATLVLPLLLAAAGKDFVIDRNLIPALVPLLLIAALGITAEPSRAPRGGDWRGAGRLLARVRRLDQLRPLAAAARLARRRRQPR